MTKCHDNVSIKIPHKYRLFLQTDDNNNDGDDKTILTQIKY